VYHKIKDQDVGFGGSARETPRHQLPAPHLWMSRQRVSPEATDKVPEITHVRSRSSGDLPDGQRQRADSEGAHPEVTTVRSRGRQRADSGVAPAANVKPSLTTLTTQLQKKTTKSATSLMRTPPRKSLPATTEDMTIVNPNADLPPRTKVLPIGLQRNGRSSALQATSATLTQPVMTSALGQRQVRAGVSMLQDQEQALEFKSLDLPDCIAYLGSKLMKGKAFEDAELRANAAGTCCLAALTCVESSRAFANKINSACKAPLPSLHGASQEDINGLKAWRENALDVGAKLAAGIFKKETEAIRQLMAKSFDLSPIDILLNSPPTEMLFSDDKKIAKAMEAADRHRPYPSRSSGPKSRGGGKVTSTSSYARRPTPYQKPVQFSLPSLISRETRKAALFVTRREAAIKVANKLRSKWSYGSCRSGHISLFHLRTLVCRSQCPFQYPPLPAALKMGVISNTSPLSGETSLAAPNMC
jgi:hypothetical protein